MSCPIPNPPRFLSRRPLGLGLAAVVSAVLSTPAPAVTDAELIGPDLVARPVKVTLLRDQTLSYFDEQRNLQSVGLDGVVQLRDIGGAEQVQTPPYPSVMLADGQRFPGIWEGATADGSGLRWRHDLIGPLVLSLDEVRRIDWRVSEADARNQVDAESDTITLVNGDTFSGFVTSLSEEGVALIPDGADEPVTVPYARIASLTLANPPRAVSAGQHRVTLADGTRVFAEDMRWSGDQADWLVTPPGGSPVKVQVPIADLARIDIGSGGFRLMDLSAVPMRALEDAGVFGLTVPVRVSGRSIRAHAPAAVSFELPAGAERFAATAELDADNAPPQIGDWADFHVVVSCESGEVARGHVNGSNPSAEVNVPISGAELVIRLDPGVNGPILDRLVIRDAVILLREAPTGPSGDSGR